MTNWMAYIQKTKGKSHTPLLEEALVHSTSMNRALDLGAGAMRDTAYLMGRGFKMIDIVYSEPYIAEVAHIRAASRILNNIIEIIILIN